jgi:predicted Zn-dependent peptidase
VTVRQTTLDSGLTVVSQPMDHLESAALGVWVGAGARSEDEDEHGLSHLLEHMAFKGTHTRTAAEIVEEIEAVGGEVNAATSVETTSYYARVLKDDVGLGLDILGDILRNSVFDAAELEREKHVILQEIGAARDAPDDRVFDLFSEAAYPDQAIGRSILGTPDTINSVAPDKLQNYLTTHYRGPSTIVSAAGAIDHEALVRQTESLFGDLSADAGPVPGAAHYVGGEAREPRDLMETQIVLGFKGRSYTSKDFYTAQLLANTLGGGMSSRLFQEIREKRGLCYSIYAFNWSFADSGVFGIHAATGPKDVAELMPVLLTELEHAGANIGETELERSKAQLRAGLLMSLESPASRAGQLARQIQLFGRVIPAAELISLVEAITVADTTALAADIFTSGTPTIAAVGQLDDVPRCSDIASRFGSAGPA